MKKKTKTETPQEVWKKLDTEWNKVFDNFKYFDEPNKLLFLNILIGEAVKYSQVSPLNVCGLLSQIKSDVHNFVRHNLSVELGKKEARSYVG